MEIASKIRDIESGLSLSLDIQRVLRQQLFSVETELVSLRADVMRVSERVSHIANELRRTGEADKN
ncbi:hypothetical protein [Ferrovibrio terrae]|uniref:hypothetical protein n=1 Tax=Ferrovibrio terrae TaxID=2594003 RepID=UPI00313800B0